MTHALIDRIEQKLITIALIGPEDEKRLHDAIVMLQELRVLASI